jgi:hypothetical protein
MGNKLRLWGLVLLASAMLRAAPLPCSDYSTLSAYIGAGSTGCQAGNILFSNFSYSFSPLSTDPAFTAVLSTSVTVGVSSSQDAPTLTFQGQWTATDGYQTELNIFYTAVALTPLPIGSSSVSFTGTVQNLGGYPSNITSDLHISPPNPAPIITLTPSLTPSACVSMPSTCTASAQAVASFSGAAQVTVQDILYLDSGGTGSGSSLNTATLSQIQQTIADAPEPSTLLAVGLGLLVCGCMAARKS